MVGGGRGGVPWVVGGTGGGWGQVRLGGYRQLPLQRMLRIITLLSLLLVLVCDDLVLVRRVAGGGGLHRGALVLHLHTRLLGEMHLNNRACNASFTSTNISPSTWLTSPR